MFHVGKDMLKNPAGLLCMPRKFVPLDTRFLQRSFLDNPVSILPSPEMATESMGRMLNLLKELSE